MQAERHFAKDYPEARERFLAAAEIRGARRTAHVLEARGPKDGELAVEVVRLGPESARSLLAISSGIHGAEGFAGSAIQQQLLEEQLDGLALPADLGVLLVHAINPFGFAHLRRVNESNVDLNRNFLLHPEEHESNPGYDELYDAVNPPDLDDEERERNRRGRILEYAQSHGFAALQEVLSRGQYAHPTGVQFGGQRVEAGNRILREVVRAQLGGAERVVWLDVHTGLGPFGECELITEFEPSHPSYTRARRWFGDRVKSSRAGESVSPPLCGVMERGISAEVAEGCELTILAPEFGTYEPARVFQAMRADNWLHHHGELESEAARAIKREIREVFAPESPEWKARVLSGGARLIEQAVAGLRS